MKFSLGAVARLPPFAEYDLCVLHDSSNALRYAHLDRSNQAR